VGISFDSAPADAADNNSLTVTMCIDGEVRAPSRQSLRVCR
jgi:hypothetical protein